MVLQNTENMKERTGVAEGVYAIEDSQAMFEAIGSAGSAGDQLFEAASDDKDFDGMLNADGEFDPKHLTDVLPYDGMPDDNGERFPDMNDSIPELTDDDKKFVVDEFSRKLQEMGTTQIDDPQITSLAVTIKGENGFPQDIEGFLRETINTATTRIGAQNVSNALPSGASSNDIAPLADGGVPAADSSNGSEFAPKMDNVPSSAPVLTPNVDDSIPRAAGQESDAGMNLGLDGIGGTDLLGNADGGSSEPTVSNAETGLDIPKPEEAGNDSKPTTSVDTEPKDATGSDGKPKDATGSNDKPKDATGSDDKPKDATGSDDKPKDATGSDDKPKDKDTDSTTVTKKDDAKPGDNLGLNLDGFGDGDFLPDAGDDKSDAPKTESVNGTAKMEGETVAACKTACGTQTDCQCKDGKPCECKDGSKCKCGTTLENGESVPDTESTPDTEPIPDTELVSDAGSSNPDGGTDTECALGKIREKYMESVQSARKAKMEAVISECKAKTDIEHRLESKISAKIEAIRERYADGKRTAKLEAICKKHSGVDSLIADCRNATHVAQSVKAKLEGISRQYHADAKTESVIDHKLSAVIEGVTTDSEVDRKLGSIVDGIRKDAAVSARLESIVADTDAKMNDLSKKKKISAKFDALLAKKMA